MSTADASLAIVTAATAEAILGTDFSRLRSVVEEAYVLHGRGRTVSPPGQVLRPPERPDERLSAMPARLGGDDPVSGVKWLASVPANVQQGVPRASAVIMLNDDLTGRPFACLEGSHISAARTAASAVLAAYHLNGRQRSVDRLGICGAGFLARYVYRFLLADGWAPETIDIFDSDHQRAQLFAADVRGEHPGRVRVCSSATEVVGPSDLVVFATTAIHPHVGVDAFRDAAPLVLHISLRDLAPEVVVASQNLVDDREHAFRDATSLGLAQARYGRADFVSGTLYDLICGEFVGDRSSPRVFAPFGLGMLDVAVGRFVYQRAAETGRLQLVPDFAPTTRRAVPAGAGPRGGVR